MKYYIWDTLILHSSNNRAFTKHLHRTCDGYGVSSYSQAKNLACHSFMDAGWLQTQNQDLSETRTSLRHSMQAELRVHVSFPHPQVPWGHMEGLRWMLCTWVCVMAQSISLGNLWLSKKICSFSQGEVLPHSSRLPAVNTTLGNNLGKEQRTARTCHSWHPVWLIVRGAQNPRWTASSNTKELKTIIFQTICVCCNMHKLYAQVFVVSKHYYSLFWANEEFEAHCV